MFVHLFLQAINTKKLYFRKGLALKSNNGIIGSLPTESQQTF